MPRFKNRTHILSAIIDAFIKPPDTTTYPFTPIELPHGFRGTVIMIDPEKCTGCSICIRDCPANALEIQRESRERYRLIHYPSRCAYCGQCEESCKNRAISQTNQTVKPTADPDSFIVVFKDTLGEDKPKFS